MNDGYTGETLTASSNSLSLQALACMIGGMEIVVSMALLVAFLGWVVAVYNKLLHLRTEVLGAWKQWLSATRNRNERLSDFADGFAQTLPDGGAASERLRQLADDSEKTLHELQGPRWGIVEGGSLPGVEWRLQRAVYESVHEVERVPGTPEHEQLHQLCGLMSVALCQQEHRTRLFNRAAQEYNAALVTLGGRMLAPLFGFLPAGHLEAPDLQTDSTE